MPDYLQPLPRGSADGGAADSTATESVQPADYNRLVGVLNGTAGTVGANFRTANSIASNPPTGTVLDAGGSWYNLMAPAYGGKGDGTTDDATAVNSAVTAATTGAPTGVRGGIIYAAGRTFPIGSTVTLPSAVFTSGAPQTYPLIFMGAGYMQDGFWSTKPFGTTFLAKNLTGDMFTAASTANIGTCVSFQQMTIVGNDTGMGGVHNSGHLLHFWNPMESWYRDLIIRGSQTDGLRTEISGIPGNMVSVDHVRSEKCPNGNGIAVAGTVQNAIFACHAETCQTGVQVGNNASQTTLCDTFLASNSFQGIVLGAAESVIEACHVETSGREGMQITGTRNLIQGNTAIGNGTSGTDPKGIRLTNATALFNIVQANLCKDIGSGKQLYGVAEENSANNNTFQNNDLRGNVTAAVFPSLVGAGTIARGNNGYNPVGAVTTPGFPATTVAVTNSTHVDCVAYITAGTSPVTVQVDAVTALMIIPASGVGTVRIPATSTFTPTYGGGVPTWKWYGE